MQLSTGDAAGPVEYDRILKIIQQSKDDLVNVGYSEFAVEDFHEVTLHSKHDLVVPKLLFVTNIIRHIAFCWYHKETYSNSFCSLHICLFSDFLGLLSAGAKLVACCVVRTFHRGRRGGLLHVVYASSHRR